MKILYGITKPNFGGAQRYVFDLATEAKETGLEVAVTCGSNSPEPLADKLLLEKIPVFPVHDLGRDISIFGDIRAFFSLLRILREFKPDVFHTNSSKMGGLGAVAGRLSGVKKIIFTSHGWEFNAPRPTWQKRVIKLFAWLTIVLSHKTICVSETTKNQVENWPFIKKKLVVIRNGLAPFDLYPRKEARSKLSLGIPDKKMLVVALSELHKVKGLDVLLEAWQKFTEETAGTLVIMGEGEERRSLEKLAEELDIRDSVIFAGFVDNARSLLAGPDVFLMPSYSEGLPYALIEAGFAGLPAIASRVGGIPEVAEDEEGGLLVEAGDSEAIAGALWRLSRDKDLRKKLSTNIKAKVKKDFSMKKMIHDTLNLYEQS